MKTNGFAWTSINYLVEILYYQSIFLAIKIFYYKDNVFRYESCPQHIMMGDDSLSATVLD